MKQQEGKERARGEQKSMEHFKFVDYEGEEGQKSRVKKHHLKSHKDGFARWSDYITYDSGQIEIPISDGESISVSPNRQESSSLVEIGNSKQITVVAPPKEEIPQTKAKYHQREKEPIVEKPVKQQLSLAEPKQKQKTYIPISPFSIPNISEIKPKESLYSNTRNSQKFLLELLNDEYQRAQQKNKAKAKVNDIEDKKQQRKSEALNSRKSNLYKQANKEEQRPKRSKQKEVVEPEMKSKRVTINDRGKIKFPNDSISGEFQYVLPSQFRDNESSKKRKLVIQQEEQDQRDAHNEPMDIIDHRKQEQQKQKANQLLEYQQLNAKFAELEKNAPKRKLTKVKNAKIIRVIDDKQDSNVVTNKNRSKQSKDESKKTVQIKQTKGNKQILANEESKIRKFKKQQRSEVQIVSRRQSTPKVYQRPKRYRHQTLPFWKSQKVIYSKQGMVLGVNNITNIAFLQIIGFQSAENIATNKVYFSSLQIKITVTLKPRQIVYSSGIDQLKIKEHKLRVKNFNELQLAVLTPQKKKESVKIMIDDIMEADIKEAIVVKKGQTFAIQNLSPSKSQSVVVCLHNNDRTQKNSPSSK